MKLSTSVNSDAIYGFDHNAALLDYQLERQFALWINPIPKLTV